MKNKNQIGRINLGRVRAINRTDCFTSSFPFPEQDVFSGRRYFGVVDNIGTPFMFCQSLGDAKNWQRIGIREEGRPFHIILLEVK